MIKQQPTLEQRIVSILAHANAGSEAIMELVAEVEDAVTLADKNIEAERAKAIDLVQSPDPKTAHERVVGAELVRDRLRAVTPKLREKLSAAMRSEAHERWLSDFSRVRQQLDEAVTLFRDYRQHAEAIAEMFAFAEHVDEEVSRINGTAPDGEHRRLRSVELEARNMQSFTRDNPSLVSTVELRDWENSGRKLWPVQSSGSLAASFAGSMAVPPHPGSHWGDRNDPIVQEQRRAVERSQLSLAAYHDVAAKDEEARINHEERERFAASRRV
jgi:hypothetical protein